MRKLSKKPFTRVYDSKYKGGCETVAFEGLEKMLLQKLISTAIPNRIQFTQAFCRGSVGYLHRHAICEMQNGDKVILVVLTCETWAPLFTTKWATEGGVIEYADGRRVELERTSRPEKEKRNIFWVPWGTNPCPGFTSDNLEPILEFWGLFDTD